MPSLKKSFSLCLGANILPRKPFRTVGILAQQCRMFNGLGLGNVPDIKKVEILSDLEQSIPRPKRVFSRNQKLRFIDAVKQKRHLWDPNHPQFGIAKVSRLSWIEIAAEMAQVFPSEEPISPCCAKKLFKNLREAFKTKYNDLQNGKIPQRLWEYMQPLQFLAEVVNKGEDGFDVSTLFSTAEINDIEDDDALSGSDSGDALSQFLDLHQPGTSAMVKTELNGDDDAVPGFTPEESSNSRKRIRPSDEVENTPTNLNILFNSCQRQISNNAFSSSNARNQAAIESIQSTMESMFIPAKIPKAESTSMETSAPPQQQQQPGPLPGVISFVLDKYSEYKKKSPTLADAFENELLKVVIAFNARPY